MKTDEFEDRLRALRPRLHRYCARMTGSAVNGEDVLQDAIVKALHARAQGAGVDNLEGWPPRGERVGARGNSRPITEIVPPSGVNLMALISR